MRVVVNPVQPKEVPPLEEPIRNEEQGQIVDLPDPTVEEKPLDADYLAEKSRTVEKETRTDEFRINPEVLAEQYSEDDNLQFEDVMDLNATEPSTGATAGNDKFRPEEHGVLAALPSPYTKTNKDGLQKPVPSSSTTSQRAGAPNNDLLNEELGSAVKLNTHEYQYASYMNQIRRLVNFYWNQQLQNVREPLTKPSYRTVVDVVIDSQGKLYAIDVFQGSGVQALDNCVVTAFHIAGPYPPPPPQLVEKDGRVYLPKFGFEVDVGSGRARYDGVDPRAGVRFPGILKAAN
ncbi:MAG: TonB C-terminal domain-containing protein [Myxococcota bacterium]